MDYVVTFCSTTSIHDTELNDYPPIYYTNAKTTSMFPGVELNMVLYTI